MGKKQLLYIIVGLILLNICTIFLYIYKNNENKSVLANSNLNEVVATIGNEKITRQEWLLAMEQQNGKDVLRNLIDEKLISKMAKKYGISVSEDEMNQEMMLVKTLRDPDDQSLDDDQLKKNIKANLLFDKLITKDVKVTEAQLKKYYDDNQYYYQIPTSYKISLIEVKTREDARQIIQALKSGSSFDALAMEASIDPDTSPQGGNIGYISKDSKEYSKEFLNIIENLKIDQYSNPIPFKEHFAVVQLTDRINGKVYSFKEVKDQIKRQVALNSIENSITPESFWKENHVKWFYGK
ncbi:peptidyl-prolyl cis-trans isomerase [Bacillus sp. FJAT-49736]|uniref:peptidylprolyl isomerase n=1 Tax=Bacillus sp. FJAT-49736 TaxID=2833582 RepID=UPI001BC95050|nr:peptidyl-prolyl cis-trans isomerase [Bacillus sp. FJAT-49736]MBS4175751.1 peptidyl-prolyl cis-trans isomerase [Bacillus sp. FJAT-49736]